MCLYLGYRPILVFFCPLHQLVGQEFDLIDVVKADLMKLFRGNLVLEVNHPIPITLHSIAARIDRKTQRSFF